MTPSPATVEKFLINVGVEHWSRLSEGSLGESIVETDRDWEDEMNEKGKLSRRRSVHEGEMASAAEGGLCGDNSCGDCAEWR
ncbi:hypothetical protein Tco_0058543 [Tanacetum coccineum]